MRHFASSPLPPGAKPVTDQPSTRQGTLRSIPSPAKSPKKKLSKEPRKEAAQLGTIPAAGNLAGQNRRPVKGRTCQKVSKHGGRQKRPVSILALVSVLGVSASLLSVTGCSNSAPTSEASQAPSSAPAPAPKEPSTWPLTGLPLVDPEAGRHPSVSVKVENSPQARPQSGLENADIVWEEMIEGGSTRYNAVFHSNLPTEIGPVRSVRPMDVPISLPLGGLFVFSGGIPAFEDMARASGMNVYNEDDAAGHLYRVRFRAMPHNLYLNAQKMVDRFGKDLQAPPVQFKFASAGDGAGGAGSGAGSGTGSGSTDGADSSAEAAASDTAAPEAADSDIAAPSALNGGTAAATLTARFPSVFATWTWDAAAGRWLRADMGRATVSRAGTQLGASNVVAIMTSAHNTGYKDPAGAPVMETELSGQGQAYVASGGKVIAATWVKDAQGDPLRLLGCDGKEIRLVPGNTWVELLPAPASFEPAVASTCGAGGAGTDTSSEGANGSDTAR